MNVTDMVRKDKHQTKSTLLLKRGLGGGIEEDNVHFSTEMCIWYLNNLQHLL